MFDLIFTLATPHVLYIQEKKKWEGGVLELITNHSTTDLYTTRSFLINMQMQSNVFTLNPRENTFHIMNYKGHTIMKYKLQC